MIWMCYFIIQLHAHLACFNKPGEKETKSLSHTLIPIFIKKIMNRCRSLCKVRDETVSQWTYVRIGFACLQRRIARRKEENTWLDMLTDLRRGTCAFTKLGWG